MSEALAIHGIRLGVAALLPACVAMAIEFAGPPALSDDFNDNAIGNLWDAFSTHPLLLTASEQDQHLAFPANAAGSAPGCCLVASGGLASRDWALDWMQDYRLRVSFHINLPSLPPPDQPAANASLDLVVASDGGELQEGVRFVFGSVIQEPNIILSPAIRMVRLGAGVVAIDTLDAPPPVMDGTLFLQYDAVPDWLRLSLTGFDDPFALVVAGLRTTQGFSRTPVVLRGAATFADGLFRSMYGDDELNLDEFEIEIGGIVATGCIADIDASGAIGVDDLLAVLAAWNRGGGEADIAPAPQGDGNVNVSDMLAVLSGWGTCP